MTDPFATADQAASYGYALPPDQAAGLLARATQAVIDAAGFGILSQTAAIEDRADSGRLDLPVPLITAVASVTDSGGTALEAGKWEWVRSPRKIAGDVIRLWHSVQGRHGGDFTVNLTYGLATVPDSLVMLTASVAYRLAASPSDMAAGVTSKSVGSVSWSVAGGVPSQSSLTADEESRLARIVPLARAWQVPQ